jgi:NTP pyrophosphatase (non-canonical NTP hydrolase)
VGEVAEVLNKRDGRKASDSEDLKSQLSNELADVIHYAFTIASLNQIDLNDVILEIDKHADGTAEFIRKALDAYCRE